MDVKTESARHIELRTARQGAHADLRQFDAVDAWIIGLDPRNQVRDVRRRFARDAEVDLEGLVRVRITIVVAFHVQNPVRGQHDIVVVGTAGKTFVTRTQLL